MRWLTGSWWELNPGERRLSWLMAANYFGLLLFNYLLKPARDSLFLHNLEPDLLPFVYILTALVAAPFTAAYARAGLKYRLDRLIALTMAVLAGQLVLLWWLLARPQPWLYFVFYSWVAVAASLTTSQFWLLASTVFDAHEAKRVFPLLGLGGIAGAFFGGEMTGLLVEQGHIGTRNLLLVALGVLIVSAGLNRAICVGRRRRLRTEHESDEEAVRQDGGGHILPLVLRSRHLLLLTGIISLTVMVGSFIDFQFKFYSWEAYAEQGDLTGFLGRFYGRMSLLSFLIQAVLASRLIRRLGAGGVLFVLPTVLLAGAGALFLMPGLLAAMLTRGGELSLKYSLDKTSRELLFLPLPLALKRRTKVFIDMFADRWARGIAGALLVLFSVVLGWGHHQITAVILGLILLWLVLALLMRREYVNSFRRAVSGREIDLHQMRLNVDDAASLGILVAALGSPNKREVRYALDLLQGVRSQRLAPAVRPLLEHPGREIRRLALNILRRNGDVSDVEAARRLLQDEDLEVRVAALGVLEEQGGDPGRTAEFLAEMLSGPQLCRNAAMAFIVRHHGQAGLRPLINGPLVKMVLADRTVWGSEARRILGAMPWQPLGCTERLWDDLLRDDDEAVVRATLRGFGKRGDTGRMGCLLERLDHPHLRLAARQALADLARLEASLVERLEAFFLEGGQSLRSRAEVPRVLARVPTDSSVAVLQRRLSTHEPELRHIVLQSLYRLRSRHPKLHFDRALVDREIREEAGRFCQLARLRDLLPREGEGAELLMKAIGEVQRLRLEGVFRLLALHYPGKDMESAYHGLFSGRRRQRANAQEFLENILSRPHARILAALLDDAGLPAEDRTCPADVTIAPQGPPIADAAGALEFVATSCDPWLAACAIHAGAAADNPAARVFLEREGDGMLSALEKALILQNVEIFTEVPTDQLAALGSIAREVAVLAGETLYRMNDRADGMYLVVRGQVDLQNDTRTVFSAGPRDPFGTWELLDEQPRLLTARAAVDTRLLFIDQGEFNDLLADDVRIVKGIIRTVSRRLRELTRGRPLE